MSHLEALIAATLRFLGVSYTETGIHFMAPFVGLVVILVAIMAVLVAFLEIRRRLFVRAVTATIEAQCEPTSVAA